MDTGQSLETVGGYLDKMLLSRFIEKLCLIKQRGQGKRDGSVVKNHKAVSEDPSSVTSTYLRQFPTPVTLIPVDSTASSGLHGHQNTHGLYRDACMSIHRYICIHMHTK